jgi:hypothetical protein
MSDNPNSYFYKNNLLPGLVPILERIKKGVKHDSSLGTKGNAKLRAINQLMIDKLFEKNAYLRNISH